MIDLSLE